MQGRPEFLQEPQRPLLQANRHFIPSRSLQDFRPLRCDLPREHGEFMKGWGRLLPNSLLKTGPNGDEAVPAPPKCALMNWPCHLRRSAQTSLRDIKPQSVGSALRPFPSPADDTFGEMLGSGP